MIKLTTPISEEVIRNLKVGDICAITGIIVTARDAGHKLMVEERPGFLDEYLNGGVIYHCGPVVKKEGEKWSFVAAGPTTSAREEPYQAKVIESYTVRGVIGKGGMGEKTLEACKNYGAVYFHAVGGCGTLLAKSVIEVITVFKLEEFGAPEAFWVCKAVDFPVIVTMDSHGKSIHADVKKASNEVYTKIMTELSAK
ncbi:MAG: fumarate hydratase C-terminal domain-containing protein [Candidatus Coatesbacteria bacterium]|nr:fumarate hydratase C-terminal domain-containing protein [Candidatus Coatesbacteria bacterium]